MPAVFYQESCGFRRSNFVEQQCAELWTAAWTAGGCSILLEHMASHQDSKLVQLQILLQSTQENISTNMKVGPLIFVELAEITEGVNPTTHLLLLLSSSSLTFLSHMSFLGDVCQFQHTDNPVAKKYLLRYCQQPTAGQESLLVIILSSSLRIYLVSLLPLSSSGSFCLDMQQLFIAYRGNLSHYMPLCWTCSAALSQR